MKAAPLLVAWHDENSPIYTAHFEPHGKGRLATGGGDHHVRLWRVESASENRKITYLSTLKKHTQAVNVVRWCPKGELLASAGDDGNVLLWAPLDIPGVQSFGEEELEDLEHWRVVRMCRSSSGSEIYDLAWSPDGVFFITGSMDNVARIYNASTGSAVRQIAEHNHYVQGVAWDPLNEYVATQSSDRSVHIYALKTKDGQPSLTQHNKVTKMDLPGRRISSHSPAPPEFGNHRASFMSETFSDAMIASPRPSAPGTPQSLALPMNPPPTSHSRRSSFGSQAGQSIRRSVSPSPSMPLPAVMPSASPSMSGSIGLGARNTNIYANETFTSFFRRLTFAPDGSLLFTPAGQFKNSHPAVANGAKIPDDVINTVYIYTRAGLNKPPVAYLPGHKKPSIAVKCSPIYYTIRANHSDTKEITIDTRTDDDIPSLPEPAVPTKPLPSHAAMDPPPLTSAPSPSPSVATLASPRHPMDIEPSPTSATPSSGPPPAFGLPYRIVYAVATQDAVHVYDTQQQRPLCVVSNLHYATFTDLTWSSDGLTLIMTSSDGFCSALTFALGELGTIYHHPAIPSVRPSPAPISVGKPNPTSAASTPIPTPTSAFAPPPYRSPSPFARPASPAMSTTSNSTTANAPDQNPVLQMNYPTPSLGSLPSLVAANTMAFTPPQTPGIGAGGGVGTGGVKRVGESVDGVEGGQGRAKKRRVAPTLVEGNGGGG